MKTNTDVEKTNTDVEKKNTDVEKTPEKEDSKSSAKVNGGFVSDTMKQTITSAPISCEDKEYMVYLKRFSTEIFNKRRTADILQ